MQKILLSYGTRPEAIKMAPLYHHLKQSGFRIVLCVTAQHREMLDQVLDFFEIVPDYDLNVMTSAQTLNKLSSKIIDRIDDILEQVKPDLVLVHGDTTTSSMVALAAFHRNIKIGHVEAGLRTFNLHSPFPEELNRQLTGRLANFHFAPTEEAASNLSKEGIKWDNIIVTGNTVIDALLWTSKRLNEGYMNEEIAGLKDLRGKKIILVTGHRRESFGEGLVSLCSALISISKEPKVVIVFPVHLNPNVYEVVREMLGNIHNIILLKPVAYPTMVWLIKNCDHIISDSGGIQEEAPTFGKHVLVTRNVSERPEGLRAGYSTLVGTDRNQIVKESKMRLALGESVLISNPYGRGDASERITKFLVDRLR